MKWTSVVLTIDELTLMGFDLGVDNIALIVTDPIVSLESNEVIPAGEYQITRLATSGESRRVFVNIDVDADDSTPTGFGPTVMVTRDHLIRKFHFR